MVTGFLSESSMADQQNRIPWNFLLIILIVGFTGWILWDVFDVGTKITIHQAVNDIVNRRQTVKARRTLLRLNARTVTVEALEEALNADNDHVIGKAEIIATLLQFKETRSVVRALHGKVASTRYAAASTLYRQKPHRDRAREIALEWIGDAGAPDRYLAIHIAAELKLDEALPQILELLDKVVAGEAGLQTARATMEALKRFQPDGVVDRVMKVAGDPQQDSGNRIEALKVLPQLKQTSKEELLPLVLGILQDKDANKILRMNAAMVLRDKDLYNKETDTALRAVLMDSSEEDHGVQRECLKRLGLHAPLDELKELLYSREVYDHDYFAIRSDVATAVAGMNLKDRVAFDILCNYLVDVDPKDKDKSFIVRREAWCSLWLLTGMMAGLKERNLFKNPYRLPEKVDRYVLFRFNRNRPGITGAMVEAMDKLTPKLDEMSKIRTYYAQAWEAIQKARADQAKAKKAKEDAEKEAETLPDGSGDKKDDAEKKAETPPDGSGDKKDDAEKEAETPPDGSGDEKEDGK